LLTAATLLLSKIRNIKHEIRNNDKNKNFQMTKTLVLAEAMPHKLPIQCDRFGHFVIRH